MTDGKDFKGVATIDDVAKLAGVSKMTVSRVINNSGYVKQQTRKRGEEAIETLKLRPNMVAKGLATGRNHVIAYMMIDISDPFHNLVSQGIEAVCYENGYTTMMCDIHNQTRETDYMNMLIDRQIDGAILHHLDISKERVEELERAGVRCVLLDNERTLEGVCNVETDNYGGAYTAARYLAEKGMKRIGCMHGPLEKAPQSDAYVDVFQRRIWRERTKGFVEGLEACGLEPVGFYPCSSNVTDGTRISKQIVRDLISGGNPPDAIYCENDTMALGALSSLLEMQYYPRQMAVVGHDGLDMSLMLYPRVTTVVQPRYSMGFESCKALIDRIEGRGGIQNILLKPELVVGDTA